MAQSYSLQAVVLMVSGIRVSGFAADGDVISVEFPGENAEDVVGADGEVAVAYSADDRAYLRLSLMESSRANRILDELATAQRLAARAGAPPATGPVLLTDFHNGDIIGDSEYFFKATPGPTKAATISRREWVIGLPRGRAQARLATARL